MHHRWANFYAGRKSVEYKPSDLVLEDLHKIRVFDQVQLGAMNGRSELTLESTSNVHQLFVRV